MIGRRRFLALLGVGTASAPLAAKAAADEGVAKLTSLRGFGAGALARQGDHTGYMVGMPAMEADQDQRHIRMGEWVRFFGKLPAHIEKTVRSSSKYVQHLDPDIACKKSWSLSVKIQEQQARNYAKSVDAYRNAGVFEKAQKAFSDTFGFNWNW